MIDLPEVHMWTERLATLPDGTSEACAVELGIQGALMARGLDAVCVVPPPEGTRQLTIVSWGAGVARIDLVLVDGFTRAGMDRELGFGADLPRVDGERPFERMYIRPSPGRPFMCTVVATFESRPEARSVTTRLSLRRSARLD